MGHLQTTGLLCGLSHLGRRRWIVIQASYSSTSFLSMPSPEARQCLRVVARDQLTWAVVVPVRGEEGGVIAIRKALVEQCNDAHVGFRADEAAGGLHDAVHT